MSARFEVVERTVIEVPDEYATADAVRKAVHRDASDAGPRSDGVLDAHGAKIPYKIVAVNPVAVRKLPQARGSAA